MRDFKIVLRSCEGNNGINIPCNIDNAETITTEDRDSYAAEENHQQNYELNGFDKKKLLRQFRA